MHLKQKLIHACSRRDESDLCVFNVPPAVCVFQECVYCEDAAPAPVEENLPHMDMGELGQELSREGPTGHSQSEASPPQPDAMS